MHGKWICLEKHYGRKKLNPSPRVCLRLFLNEKEIQYETVSDIG